MILLFVFLSAAHANEFILQQQFKGALATVKQILNTTRHPEFPAEVPHSYQDKYTLAESLTNTALAAELNVLAMMGLQKGQLANVQQWVSDKQSVSMGFRRKVSCSYLRNETKQVVESTRVKTGKVKRSVQKTFKNVVSHFYLQKLSWQFVVYRGTPSSATEDDSRTLTLEARNASVEVMFTHEVHEDQCLGGTLVMPSRPDVDVTWLFQNLNSISIPSVVIDRNDKDCHTPRRNKQIDQALSFFSQLFIWADWLTGYFPPLWSPRFDNENVQGYLNKNVFVPVIPLFEAQGSCDSNCTVSLSVSDLNAMLAEQQSSLNDIARDARQIFPSRSNSSVMISELEAQFWIFLQHQVSIVQAYRISIEDIEDMLRDQLRQAIGKDISPADFGEYVRVNNNHLFKPAFRPTDLSFSVRRPEHDPEGEIVVTGNSQSPSLSRTDRARELMNVTLSGGTVIGLNGTRSLHAALFYQFLDQDASTLTLSARARQFSSYVLLVGNLVSANEFRADIGVIIKNKDEMLIPLLLETLPTPKAFRDAITSLSPEQRAFAKAFRSMQLTSTLFAFAIIQVKPQLEKLMKLPSDSLTKEIQLTQDLMRLFLDYQLPPDLLSFQGSSQLAEQEKIDYVKAQVAKMNSFVENEKQLQIKEKQLADELLPREIEVEKLASEFLYWDNDDSSSYNEPVDYPSQPSYPMRVPASYAVQVPVPVPAGYVAESYSVRVPVSYPVRVPASLPSGHAGSAQSSSDRIVDAKHYGMDPSTSITTSTSTSTSTTAVVKTPATAQPLSLANESTTTPVDYTAVPARLDARVLEFDDEASLHAVIIKPAKGAWQLKSQQGLLGNPKDSSLYGDEQDTARQKAFDLLESLSKSGILAFDEAEFHVVIGATQSFEQSLIDTVIQQNDNPIALFERSSLIVATTIFGLPAADLVAPDQLLRLAAFSPKLFPDARS